MEEAFELKLECVLVSNGDQPWGRDLSRPVAAQHFYFVVHEYPLLMHFSARDPYFNLWKHVLARDSILGFPLDLTALSS